MTTNWERLMLNACLYDVCDSWNWWWKREVYMSFSFFFSLFFRYSTNNTNIKMRSDLQQLDRFIFSKEKKKNKFFFWQIKKKIRGKNEELKNKQTNKQGKNENVIFSRHTYIWYWKNKRNLRYFCNVKT